MIRMEGTAVLPKVRFLVDDRAYEGAFGLGHHTEKTSVELREDNWARTALMLMLFTVFGYEMNLEGFVQMITDGASAIGTLLLQKSPFQRQPTPRPPCQGTIRPTKRLTWTARAQMIRMFPMCLGKASGLSAHG